MASRKLFHRLNGKIIGSGVFIELLSLQHFWVGLGGLESGGPLTDKKTRIFGAWSYVKSRRHLPKRAALRWGIESGT